MSDLTRREFLKFIGATGLDGAGGELPPAPAPELDRYTVIGDVEKDDD